MSPVVQLGLRRSTVFRAIFARPSLIAILQRHPDLDGGQRFSGAPRSGAAIHARSEPISRERPAWRIVDLGAVQGKGRARLRQPCRHATAMFRKIIIVYMDPTLRGFIRIFFAWASIDSIPFQGNRSSSTSGPDSPEDFFGAAPRRRADLTPRLRAGGRKGSPGFHAYHRILTRRIST